MPEPQLSIIHRAIAHGDRTAIQSRGRETSYRNLLTASEAVAASLLNGAEDLGEARVAHLVPPGEHYVHTQWGIWRAGGVAVPLSLSATEKELEYTLTDSQASIVIVTNELEEKVASLCNTHHLRLLTLGALAAIEADGLPSISAERAAMILYTSGTTSKPKGVVTTHACIEAQIASLISAWEWHPDDRIPLFLPLHHIHGASTSCRVRCGWALRSNPLIASTSIRFSIASPIELTRSSWLFPRSTFD
ncbi:MAG: AMP-binding protein [Planctomycetota bacterium]